MQILSLHDGSRYEVLPEIKHDSITPLDFTRSCFALLKHQFNSLFPPLSYLDRKKF